jgi:hypothetical protein
VAVTVAARRVTIRNKIKQPSGTKYLHVHLLRDKRERS